MVVTRKTTVRARPSQWLGFLAIVAIGLAVTATAYPGDKDSPEPPRAAAINAQNGKNAPAIVKIGMLKSMFRDVPASMIPAMNKPFQMLVKSQTGLEGDTVLIDTLDDLRQQLVDGQVQLAVFHGFEFAWVKLKQPDLVPIMLAGSNPNALKAVVVVKADSSVQNVHDLQGQTLAFPNCTREHTRLYMSRHCCCNKSPQEYFAATSPPPQTVEDALEAVVEGKAQVTVVEASSLEMFRDRKPGRYKRLRTIETSEAFPNSVIAYRPGGLDETSVQKFKDGMSTAHVSPVGARMMSFMKMTKFEQVPQNFDQMMAEVVKAYPPPW